MNAAALALLAEAGDMWADRLASAQPDPTDWKRAQTLRIAASDARHEAEAASGYGTEATLAWSICVDNDRETFDTIRAMVAEHADNETARADLADALKDWTENMAGTEGAASKRNSDMYGTVGGGYTLSPLMLTLIRSAIVAIDWHALAIILLAEHQESNG